MSNSHSHETPGGCACGRDLYCGRERPRPSSRKAREHGVKAPPDAARPLQNRQAPWSTRIAWSRNGRNSERSGPAQPSGSSRTAKAARGCIIGPSRRFSTSTPLARSSKVSETRCSCRRTDSARTATGISGQETAGPFGDVAGAAGRGFQMFKFDPNGKVLLTLGQAGVSKAGPDTFVGPTACAIAPNGDVIVSDGHWPRPTTGQQDGDRLIRFTRSGQFVKDYGKMGTRPGEFMGPHALAFDSQGRLFVADRSNNRVQIFDKDMNFVDEWRHFGRPSGIAILKDDTLIVADSESSQPIGGPPQAPEGGGNAVRNPGWRTGIRIGSAKDGSLKYFIPGTRPEGMAADELGNIFAGLTAGCTASPSGGCLQKFVRR